MNKTAPTETQRFYAYLNKRARERERLLREATARGDVGTARLHQAVLVVLRDLQDQLP